MSEKRIIKHKAPWTLQETIPIVVLYAGAILSAIGGLLTETIAPALGWIGLVTLGFIATYVLVVGAGRKKKSMLIAELSDDKDLTIEVIMVKPQQHKWRNKLDRGNNIVRLGKISSVKFDKVLGTRIMTIVTSDKDKKVLYLPLRLAEVPEIKDYLGLAVARNSKIKFEKKEWATEFATYVNLPEDDVVKKHEETAPVIETEEVEEVTEETNEEQYGPGYGLEIPEKEKEVIRLTYERFRRKSTSEKIGDAILQIDAPLPEEGPQNGSPSSSSHLDNLLLNLDERNKTSKITIDLTDLPKEN